MNSARMTTLAAIEAGVLLLFLQTVPTQFQTVWLGQPETALAAIVRNAQGALEVRTEDDSRIGVGTALRRPVDAVFPVPTSTWWSSGYFDDWPAPQFPWPLRIDFSPDGIRLNAPGSLVSGKTVFHTNADADAITVTPSGPVATKARAVSWGDFDVTFALSASKETLAHISFMQGSPVAVIALDGRSAEVRLPVEATASAIACSRMCTNGVVVTTGNRRYIVATDSGQLSANNQTLSVRGAAQLSVTALAPGSDAALYLPYVFRVPRNTRVAFTVDPFTIHTTYTLPAPSLVGILPHQQPFLDVQPSPVIGRYETLHGPIVLTAASAFSTTLPYPPLLPGLPPPPEISASLIASLRKDVENPLPASGNIYEAAKNTWRLANLLDMTRGAGIASVESDATLNLRGALIDWCTIAPGEKAQHFVYDTALGGIVGIPPAFGSEHFNDHHFHWGYFIRSIVSLAGVRDPFVHDYHDCIELLLRDIAADRGDPFFPYQRHFDPYAGHSWANGLTRFDDGQNQESTSEAMQAWHAIALYGRATGDKKRAELGAWMYAQEAVSTRTYWMNALPTMPTLPAAFTYPMISILWQGKADYQTFFDPDPTAVHGIQFFPFSTVLLPVLDENVLTKLVRPLATPGSLWGTTLEMARAFGGDAIWLPEENVPFEPGYSRSYLRFSRDSLEYLGASTAEYVSEHGCAAAFRKGGTVRFAMYRFPGESSVCRVRAPNGSITEFKNLAEGWNLLSASAGSAGSTGIPSHAYDDAIQYLKTSGIASGYPNGTFGAEKAINRAEFTKILVTAGGVMTMEKSCDPEKVYGFPDASKTEWYAAYLCRAVQRSFIGGYPDGTFRPGDSILFAEAAKMTATADLFAAGIPLERGLPQGRGGEWYERFVDYLRSRDAVPASIRSNDQRMTRGEMAEMIYKLHLARSSGT